MRRVAPAIPPSVFRHFAIVTLALTTTLAMFAEGENREVQPAGIQPGAAEEKQAPAIVRREPAQASAPASFGWNDDSDVDGGFGQPMERLLGTGGSSLIPEEARSGAGYSPEYLASLSEEERELLLRGKDARITGAYPTPR
jgi:hypothetical protein